MAITKRKNTYRAKIRGSDGFWITKSFPTKREAQVFEDQIRGLKRSGDTASNRIRHLTVAEYFEIWHQDTKGLKSTDGWRLTQVQMFRDYVAPFIGGTKLQDVSPAMISRILQSTKGFKGGRSSQTCRHVFNLLHKVFRDAVELHEYIEKNPVKRNLKPDLIRRETPFLTSDGMRNLLTHVRGQTFEVAIWLGFFLGLRVGEIQGLIWKNVDLERGVIHIRRTYARREKKFREYPKGRKWHDVAIPPELLEILNREKMKATSEFVVLSPRRPFLNYDGYLIALKRYCGEVGITKIATHGLRHSATGLWKDHGATNEDVRMLFAHSDPRVTEGYIRDNSLKKLGEIANVIRLFPKNEAAKISECSQNVPKSQDEIVAIESQLG